GERNTIRDDLLAAAAALRKAAGHLHRVGLRPNHQLGDNPQIDPWIETAEDVEAKADDLDRMALVVERDRGMLFERGKGVQLARMTSLLFDAVLPGIVAMLMEDLIGRPIEAWRITDWVESAEKE